MMNRRSNERKKKHDESSTHVLERSDSEVLRNNHKVVVVVAKCVSLRIKKKKVCIIYLDIRHQKSAPEENEKF